MARLERRTVVSVLLFPSKSTKPYQVLLFRRSEKVHTYTNKLAPIAGSVEESDKTPLDAAWRELKEETCLGPQHVELWRRGPGFEFTDETAVSGKDGQGEKIGRIWKVWPFAFRFQKDLVDEHNNVDTSVLKIDWEHLSCEWNYVDDILTGKILDQCVPRLEVTLGQVWVDPDSPLHHGLEELRLDHTNGARQLATKAVQSLIKIVEHEQRSKTLDTPGELAKWWKTFCLQAFHLAFNGRPSMGAAISSAVVTALKAAQEEANFGFANVKQSLALYVERRGEISRRVSEQFAALLHDEFEVSNDGQSANRPLRILTLSSSSTIKAAILHVLDTDETRLIELRILESRPLFEGVGFAQALTKEAQGRRQGLKPGLKFHERLRLVVASDASVGILSRDADILIIGADRISESGDVSSKTGSLPAALTSREVTRNAVRVVCISETEKIASPGASEEHEEEDNDYDEVAQTWKMESDLTWDEMVIVRNVYFEWVPAQLIDYYVCEDGVLLRDDIKEKSKLISDLTSEVFSRLQET
ncbi:hypothetical protein EDD37DRAFT_641667 [Exophiala viscosa]|uniref:uncharacterized protein n=1 Tax=Exophiala viscosa TaxID=2486360 RepID=UPI0021959843|nr:hypothetical protein EDD37DRAFT_641667 [Exophiala viscosa]